MRALTIIGAGGQGRLAAEIAQANSWGDISFLDPERRGHAGGWPIKGLPSEANIVGADGMFFVGIEENDLREAISQRLESFGIVPIALVHPTAHVSAQAVLGPGCLIGQAALVGHQAQIGAGAVVGMGAAIEHDCRIQGYVHLGSGVRLAHGSVVGARAEVEIGAVICAGVSVGADAAIGPGSAVMDDVAAGARVIGVPAKPMEA
ncbi:MAG: hypothetical protein AAGI70_16900 [Pseudomonadota bacterium]